MTCNVHIGFDHGPMGPVPRQAVSALAELGLSDTEIARYFGVRRGLVRRLKERSRAGERSKPGGREPFEARRSTPSGGA